MDDGFVVFQLCQTEKVHPQIIKTGMGRGWRNREKQEKRRKKKVWGDLISHIFLA